MDKDFKIIMDGSDKLNCLIKLLVNNPQKRGPNRIIQEIIGQDENMRTEFGKLIQTAVICIDEIDQIINLKLKIKKGNNNNESYINAWLETKQNGELHDPP
ncbi:MAG: hypothetical protein Ta2E_13080 [Mycoplasmoidaceae bacterium]|nr:MAG: hypothetical protein Ta2E_13080 [Mycoplasmoidaceae bacterium]